MSRIVFPAPLLVMLLFAQAPAVGAEHVVWQIGQPDESYMEFAIAKNYPAYAERFLKDPPVFEVGTSEPGRDWPFIHPGPADAWAGNRRHPFAIRFSLPDEPRGVFTLRVALRDTHGRAPPVYAITLGGGTGRFPVPRGAGDDSLRDPTVGRPHTIELELPATLFRKGANEIVLVCEEGSWVQYDAVTLLNNADQPAPQPGIQSVTAKATPFFVRSAKGVRRAVDVNVALTAPPSELTLRVEAAGESFEVPVRDIPFIGNASQEVAVPDSPEPLNREAAASPLEVKVTAVMGDQAKSTTVTVALQRKWRLFLAPSAHTDIGYTDVQPKCRERHNENLDLAAELIDRFGDFKWNCEVAWQAENYLADREGDPRERFLRLARERRLGVQALYCNILTGLCSHEELCRLTYFAHKLHREHEIPYVSAMINDVPTVVGSMPMVLANSGIRYFSEGSNNTRAVTFTEMYDKSPCWWEGPDGSRVLMTFQPSYAYAVRMGLQDSLQTARQRILGMLAGYEARDDYPYDAVYLNGAVSDNQPLNPRLAEIVEAWNARYEYPKIVLCHNAEFYEYVEEKYGDRLPAVRGSGGTYWEDGAGSSARETALCRGAHEAVAGAERLLALAHRLEPDRRYPGEAIYEAWQNCMLYDEHTWGAHCSISQPESDFTKAQWEIKSQFAHDAHRQSHELLEQGARGLASLVGTEDRSLVVLNTMSWPRSDLVEVELPEGMAVVDPDVTSCRVAGKTLACVKDVPACGYRVLRCGPRADVPSATEPAEAGSRAGTKIESRFYRVTFDPATGAITSLVDKELGRELVDPAAPYPLNQYLYVSGGKGTSIERGGRPPAELSISTPEEATLRTLDLGELGQRMIVETSAAMTPKIVSEVTVYDDLKRVDVTNRLTKTLTYEKEAVYFAFPFEATEPVLRYEVPCAILRPDQDLLPGACLDWFTVQHFVEIADGDAAIAWSTPDAPLVSFQDINRGKWQTELPIQNGHVYAYVMNNYWFTNYLAGQDGPFTFRFSITSRQKSDVVASAQAGWAASNPLVAVKADANPNGALPAESTSLVGIAEPNVLLIGMKRAETSDALVLRFWEMTGKPTTAHVRLPHVPVRKATLCNLVEEPQEECALRDGTISVPVRASGLATVAVE
jgi:hypothetical protein